MDWGGKQEYSPVLACAAALLLITGQVRMGMKWARWTHSWDHCYHLLSGAPSPPCSPAFSPQPRISQPQPICRCGTILERPRPPS